MDVFEQVEYQLEIDVLKLMDLALRKAVGALLGHFQGFFDQPFGKSAFNLDGQLVKKSFRMLPEQQPQKLQQNEAFCKVRIFTVPYFFLETVALHFSQKGFDDLRHK